jgi:uncharacterized membrane protein
MDEQLVQRIVKDLARHRDRNEIIREVCEQSGLNWPEADQLVQQVAQEHRRSISRRQGPLMIFLSVGTLLIGVALLLQGLEFFMAFFQGETLQQILSLRTAYLRIIGGLTGLGMLVGGLLGTWKSVLPFLED